jgi:GntR family transcriptional regulator
MKQLGLAPRTELVEVGPVTPSQEVAERLELGPEEHALIRRRRMYASDEPMQLATSYIPWSLAEGTQMVEPDTGPGGIYSRLADIGLGPVRFTEEVSTRLATPDEVSFLGLTAPAPVFYLVRTAFDGEDRPVEICKHIMSGERWQLSYEWQAD